jgi:hypothetical protein
VSAETSTATTATPTPHQSVDCNEAPVVHRSSTDREGTGVAAYALDAANATRLWELSEATFT